MNRHQRRKAKSKAKGRALLYQKTTSRKQGTREYNDLIKREQQDF